MGSQVNYSSALASLASASNDSTLAFANVNFDFSLVKIEAPKEFHELGSALSTSRREAAEFGSIHQTARRFVQLYKDFDRFLLTRLLLGLD